MQSAEVLSHVLLLWSEAVTVADGIEGWHQCQMPLPLLVLVGAIGNSARRRRKKWIKQ